MKGGAMPSSSRIGESGLPSVEEVGWLQDRVSLLFYRLRAARYGSKILLKVANTGVIIGLILGVIGAAGVIGAGLRSIGKAISVHFRVQLPHPPAMVAEGWSLVPYAAGATTIVVVLWYVIRYLGNLPRIMRTAASASDG